RPERNSKGRANRRSLVKLNNIRLTANKEFPPNINHKGDTLFEKMAIKKVASTDPKPVAAYKYPSPAAPKWNSFFAIMGIIVVYDHPKIEDTPVNNISVLIIGC